MKINRIAVAVGLLMGLALSLALAPQPAQARDGSELVLFQKLNGELERPVQSDGGGLLLFVADGGIASVTVSGGGNYYFENTGTVICHLCNPQPNQSGWDGGCNTTVADPNYGAPVAVGGYKYRATRDTTTTFKAVPASGGASCTMPVWLLR